MHGHFSPIMAAITTLHVAVIAGFFYFMYNINKSLKRIADNAENKG